MSRKTTLDVAGHNRSAVLLLVLVNAAMFLLPACNCGGNGSSLSRKQRLKFDAEKWRSGNAELRGSMANDLYSRKTELLVGKAMPAIEKLLGKPDSVVAESWSYQVDIGQDFLGSPWMYAVTIMFDEDGVAKDAMLMD